MTKAGHRVTAAGAIETIVAMSAEHDGRNMSSCYAPRPSLGVPGAESDRYGRVR